VRAGRQAKAGRFTASCRDIGQPPEKPTACPNEPKPPRATWLYPASEVPETDEPDEEPLLEK